MLCENLLCDFIEYSTNLQLSIKIQNHTHTDIKSQIKLNSKTFFKSCYLTNLFLINLIHFTSFIFGQRWFFYFRNISHYFSVLSETFLHERQIFDCVKHSICNHPIQIHYFQKLTRCPLSSKKVSIESFTPEKAHTYFFPFLL